MKIACQLVAAALFLLHGTASGNQQHVVGNKKDDPAAANEDAAAEADRIANEVEGEVSPQASAQSAQESADTAKHAAIIANKVAEHSVKITGHAKDALKHALHALHSARVDSKDIGKRESDTLKKAEKKLQDATKRVDHGKLKRLESAEPLEKGKMEEQLQKKREGSELEQMKKDVRELRRKLKQKGGDAESDKELEQLQSDLDQLEKDADSGKSDVAVNDEMKAEIERLRNQIDQYESKKGGKPSDEGRRLKDMGAEATPVQEKGIDIDTSMPYGDLEPFGREDTAQELTESSVRESDAMVDQLERAEVAEEKRAVFRALTRLRGAAITSFDGVARSQTGNIDEYNKVNKWRKSHPLHHLADEESDISKWAFPDNADLVQVKHKSK